MTNATNPDSDGDGFTDGEEVTNFTDPNDPTDPPPEIDNGGIIPDDTDYDQTELPAIGISVSYNPATEKSTISWYNIDGDGLSDQEEFNAIESLSSSVYFVYRHTTRILSLIHI